MSSNVIFDRLVQARKDTRDHSIEGADRKELLKKEGELINHLAELKGVTRKRAVDLADLQARLEEFQAAAAQLNRTWELVEGRTGTEIANFPQIGMSFDEFTADVADMEVAI